MDNHHHMSVRELDLRDCNPSYMADTVVPGLRTSAAFFTFLRANLVLSPSAMSSNTNTPYLEPWTSQTLPPVSPSPLATYPPLEPLDDIPPLSLEPLQTQDDKVEGLRLVADSVAQMKPRAAASLISHPLSLGLLSAAWAAVYRFVYVPTADAGTAIVVCCGVVVAYLLTIRSVTSSYVTRAERIGRSWLQGDDGDDLVIGARYGEELIGALVLRLEPKVQPPNKRKSRDSCLKGGRGVIRAWTTKLQHRGKGIGKDLLVEAVKAAKDKCGKDAEVGFAAQHANSPVVLPGIFNGVFRKDEIRATGALQEVVDEWEASKRRKR